MPALGESPTRRALKEKLAAEREGREKRADLDIERAGTES
jgi:hypothetical protein